MQRIEKIRITLLTQGKQSHNDIVIGITEITALNAIFYNIDMNVLLIYRLFILVNKVPLIILLQYIEVQRQNLPDQQQFNADTFIRCCTALQHAVIQSIPCLRKVLQKWLDAKRKEIGLCERAQSASYQGGCSEKGKPTSSSSCASCVAWGKAVEGVYYPQKSKGNIPWDDINPTCLAESHFMVAKAFLQLQRARECTELEQLDLAGLLDIMMGFKEFLGGEKSTYNILKKVRTFCLATDNVF